MKSLNGALSIMLVVVLMYAAVPVGWALAKNVESSSDSKWIQVQGPTSLPLNSIDMVSDDDGWAVGSSGIILLFTNGEWQEIQRPTADYLTAVSMLDENNGWAVGSDAVLRYSSGQWQPFPHPSPIFPESVATVSDKDAWILEGSRVLQFTATDWQLPQSLNDVQRMMDITMLDENTGWAVGFNGIILRYDGQEWSRAGSPTSDRLYSVSFGGGSNGWAVGGNYPRYGNSTGTVLHYVAGQWITVDVPGIPALTSVSGTPDGSAWAMSPEGIAVHLYADGTHEAFNIPRSVKSVDMVSDSEGWAVGDNGLILHFTPGSLPTDPVEAPGTSSPNQVYFQRDRTFSSLTASSLTGKSWWAGDFSATLLPRSSPSGILCHQLETARNTRTVFRTGQIRVSSGKTRNSVRDPAWIVRAKCRSWKTWAGVYTTIYLSRTSSGGYS